MTGQRFLSKKRILLTGAAGGIGSAFFRSAAGQYTFRLADVNKTANWLRRDPNARHLSGYVSERDLNHLLVRCIEAPHLHFAVVYGISNNRFKRLDITSTRTLVEYAPQDDAFEIFHADLQTWLQG